MRSDGEDFHHKLSYFGQAPEDFLSSIHCIDNYILCFRGPTDDCIDLSNRIIDKFYSETGYTAEEKYQRATWLKSEMTRRLLANSIPNNDPTGNA